MKGFIYAIHYITRTYMNYEFNFYFPFCEIFLAHVYNTKQISDYYCTTKKSFTLRVISCSDEYFTRKHLKCVKSISTVEFIVVELCD